MTRVPTRSTDACEVETESKRKISTVGAARAAIANAPRRHPVSRVSAAVSPSPRCSHSGCMTASTNNV